MGSLGCEDPGRLLGNPAIVWLTPMNQSSGFGAGGLWSMQEVGLYISRLSSQFAELRLRQCQLYQSSSYDIHLLGSGSLVTSGPLFTSLACIWACIFRVEVNSLIKHTVIHAATTGGEKQWMQVFYLNEGIASRSVFTLSFSLLCHFLMNFLMAIFARHFPHSFFLTYI